MSPSSFVLRHLRRLEIGWVKPESAWAQHGGEFLGREGIRAEELRAGLGGVGTVQYNQSFLEVVSDFQQ